jgi:alginate O-acetyltransferase complex protein AlgI
VFFICVFIAYWAIFSRSVLYRNIFLLIVSYVFYGWWDYKFLTLIFLSSITDFVTGLGIGSAKKRHVKIFYLILSITVNLGALIVFKYYNFFIDSFSSIVTILGFQANVKVLSLILPVGISFYTFQTMSYTIDIYVTAL